MNRGNFGLEFPLNPGGNKAGFNKLVRHFSMHYGSGLCAYTSSDLTCNTNLSTFGTHI